MNLGALRARSQSTAQAPPPRAVSDGAAPRPPTLGETMEVAADDALETVDDDIAGVFSEVGSTIAVWGIAAQRRRAGKKPNEPEEKAVERFERMLQRRLLARYRGRAVPAWLDVFLCSSGLYLSMAVDNEPLEQAPAAQPTAQTQQAEPAREPAQRPPPTPPPDAPAAPAAPPPIVPTTKS